MSRKKAVDTFAGSTEVALSSSHELTATNDATPCTITRISDGARSDVVIGHVARGRDGHPRPSDSTVVAIARAMERR